MKRNKHNILILVVNLIKSFQVKHFCLQNMLKREAEKKNANAYKIELWAVKI